MTSEDLGTRRFQEDIGQDYDGTQVWQVTGVQRERNGV